MIAAEWMGAGAVVVHSGYIKGNKTRREAVDRVIEGYRRVIEALPSNVKRPYVAPETMGKVSQVGDLSGVIEICSAVDRCRPCVDWAHLYARHEGGFITSVDDVIRSIEEIERNLGSQAVRPLHTHFSKIRYGPGGEREHHTMDEEGYGPDWRIVCRGYLETGVDGVIISESPVLEKDALVMKRLCEEEASGLRPQG